MSRLAPRSKSIRFPLAQACTCRTRHRQMEKRDDLISVKQAALGQIEIIQRVAARRRESRLRQSQLPCGLCERRCGIGARQRCSHQSYVLRSRQRYLHCDANFASVESNALGDQLGLRVSRIVTEVERGLPRACQQSPGTLRIRLRRKDSDVAGHPVGKKAGGGFSSAFQEYGLDRLALNGECPGFSKARVLRL